MYPSPTPFIEQTSCQDAASHSAFEFKGFVKWRISKCPARRQISDVKAEIWFDAAPGTASSNDGPKIETASEKV
jgi:hypothetical protein